MKPSLDCNRYCSIDFSRKSLSNAFQKVSHGFFLEKLSNIFQEFFQLVQKCFQRFFLRKLRFLHIFLHGFFFFRKTSSDFFKFFYKGSFRKYSRESFRNILVDSFQKLQMKFLHNFVQETQNQGNFLWMSSNQTSFKNFFGVFFRIFLRLL